MSTPLDSHALDQLFRKARTFNGFKPLPVSDETVRALYELVKWGPTAFNSQPSRYVFLRSAEAKSRLAPALSTNNREKTVKAPLNVIVAYDTRFFEYLPALSASPKAKGLFEDNPNLVEPTVLRNGSLQTGYLVIAARSLGLDIGVMTGFNAELVNREFFPDGRYKVNVIANLGYGDDASVSPRAHRLPFDEVAKIL
jgi:3-hydroxypropanoate dehydrogenase